jgi:RNA recognition motif-containing protein/inhibitor of KinA sporulation pathway (predicted exonuclease)
MDEDRFFNGRIIELDWCAFDVKKLQVVDDVQNFIKPNDGFILTQDQIVSTGITQENLSEGSSLAIVIKKFIDSCFYNYTSKNKSFCLVTFGDLLMTKILPYETRDLNIKLPQYFLQYFDILYEFKRFYPQTNHVQTIGDMLHYLQLREMPIPNLCQVETKSMIRIMNKLARDNHHFVAPRLLNQRHEPINKVREVAGSRKQTYKRWSAYIRGRSPEPFKNPNREYVIRVRGLPYESRELEIISFFKGIRIMEKNIAFLYNLDGKFTGEVFIKLMNIMDYKEALSYHMGDFHHKIIEVYESNLEDWNKALESKNPEKRDTIFSMNREEILTLTNKNGYIHVTGLSSKVTEKDILGFFSNQNVANQGIKRSIISGKPSDEAYIVLVDEQSADQACKLSGEFLAGKVLKITKKDKSSLEDFLSRNFINHNPFMSRENIPPISLEKRKTTLIMTGLPMDITREEILTIFRNFNVIENEIVFTTMANGTFSGNILIPFEDELEAQKALKTKNLTYIRNRYVELFEFR